MTEQTPPHVHGDMLRAAAARFPTGVAIVASLDQDEQPVGCTVSSFLSVSLDPPIVAVSMRTSSTTLQHIRAAQSFGVSVLSSEQRAVANQFASPDATHESRFSSVHWQPGWGDVPLLETSLSALACSVEKEVEAGDHVLILGRVHQVFVQGWGGPLVHHQGSLSTLRAV